MKQRRSLLVIVALLLLVLAAAVYVYLQNSDELIESNVDGEDIVNVVEPVPVIGQILVWQGDGIAPGQQNPGNPGSFVRYSGTGKRETLMPVPEGTTRMFPCSERATSSDGRNLIFYAGHDEGTLFQYDRNGNLNKVDEVGALTCLGMGTFQYADDGSRFGYIDFTRDATSQNTPVGTLVIRQTSDRSEQGRFENVTAFDLMTASLAYVGFFDQNKQAAVFFRQGGNTIEVGTLSADNNCTYRAGDIDIVSENRLLVLLGQSCPGRGSSWNMHTINVEQRSSTRIHGGAAGGNYFGNVRINALFVTPDGDTVYFMVPNGVSSDRADLYAVSVSGDDEPERLLRNVIMPEFIVQSPHNPSRNAWPVVSPDRGWLAVATNSANNEAAVNLVDLTASDPIVVTLGATGRGDSISAMAFSQDGSRLLFVSGGNTSGDNALFAVNMSSQIEERIARGRYANRLAVAPDGSAAALGEWQLLDDPVSDRLLNLVRVDLAEHASGVLRTGADITSTRLANRRFFYPLQWR